MEYICKCNKCNKLLIDTNPQIGAKEFEVDYLKLDTLVDHSCPNCKVDDYLTDDVMYELWSILGDIPCDAENNEYIEEKFLHFEVDSEVLEIWHWFEETFDISVAKDLMNCS